MPWTIGMSDIGSFYVEQRTAYDRTGEIEANTEREALELGITCAADCRRNASASLRAFRARLKRLPS